MRRILVTGGSGFIGTNLVELYREEASTEILNYDHRKPRHAEQADHWVEGEIVDGSRLVSVMTDFRATHLVHLAARTDLDGQSMDDYRFNTEGVRVVMKSATTYGSLERSLFASSRLVCALGERPTCEYDYFPPNHYGRSKVIGEQLVRAHDGGLDWVLVRPTSIWGPWGQAPYRDFFLSLARGTYVHPGHEKIWKHYGYVGNTAFQMDRLLTAPAQQVVGRTFYLADPAIEVGAFAAAIRRAMGLSAPRSVPVPVLALLARSGDALRAAHLHELPITTDRLRNLRTTMLFDLDETSGIVGSLPYSMEEGVSATVAHLRDQGDIRR